MRMRSRQAARSRLSVATQLRQAVAGAAVMVGLCIAGGPAASAAVVFSDNFDAGASPAWGDERGGWRDTGGTYDATNPSNSPVTYSSVTTLPGLTDFSVDVDVLGFDDGGVWLRSSFGGGNISGVLLVTGGFTGSNDGLYWHVVTGGSFSGVLSPGAAPGVQGTDQHLRIDVVGNTYSAYLGSTLITTLVDNTYSSGAAGLYDFSPTSGASSPRGQMFDNFVITTPDRRIPEPASLALFGAGLIGLFAARRARA